MCWPGARAGAPKKRPCVGANWPNCCAACARRATAEPLVSPRTKGEPFRPIEPARGFREVSLAESFETYRPSVDELIDRFWSNFEDITRPKAERLEGPTVEVVVSPEDAQWGGQVRVWIPARAACSERARHRALGLSLSHPHGWEDLPAFFAAADAVTPGQCGELVDPAEDDAECGAN